MRTDIALLDQASDRFLDAAIDPSRWKSVLEDVAKASAAFGAAIVPVFGQLIGHGVYSDSLEPNMEAYYRDGWNQRDFRAQHVGMLRTTNVLLEQDFATADDFAALEFYRALAEFGLRWTAILGFGAGQNVVTLVLHRQIVDGPFELAEADALRAVRQKLMTAGSVMAASADVEVRGQSAAFDMAGIGCVFFDRSGRVTLANERALKLLGDDLQITAGRLRAKRSADTAKLDMRLTKLLTDGASFGGEAIAIERAGRRPLIVRMQRVSGVFQEMFGTASAIALLEDPEDRVLARSSTLANAFGLTAREAEIALLLSQGAGVATVGRQLNISYETVRSHVRVIFRKTGTNSQSQLAGLVGSIRL